MRDNPVKTTLAAGGSACGAMLFEFFSPGLPQICKNAGADFVLFDMEHTGLSFESLKIQLALCRRQRVWSSPGYRAWGQTTFSATSIR